MADKFELTDATPPPAPGKANVKWQSDVNGNISAYVAIEAQTPWAQDIEAAVHDLNNVGVIRFASYTEPGPVNGIGNEAGTLHLLTDNGGSIDIESIGTGRIMMSTDSIRRLVVRQNGNVGIGPSMNPSYTLDIQGDCNVDGVYRVDGVPINTGGPHVIQDEGVVRTQRDALNFVGAGVTVTDDGPNSRTTVTVTAQAQTPWAQNVDAAGYTLNNASSVTLNNIPPSNAWSSAPLSIYGRITFSPRITFIWAGVNAVQLGSDGGAGATILRTYDLDGTAYAPFAAAQIESKSGGFKFPDGTTQTTAGQKQTPWAQAIAGAGHPLTDVGKVSIRLDTSYGLGWSEAALVIYGNLTTSQPARVTFAWEGAWAVQLGVDRANATTIRTYGLDTTAYAPFAAAQITANNGLVLLGLPTVGTGPSGTVWRDAAAGNVLKIVP